VAWDNFFKSYEGALLKDATPVTASANGETSSRSSLNAPFSITPIVCLSRVFVCLFPGLFVCLFFFLLECNGLFLFGWLVGWLVGLLVGWSVEWFLI
jgi:hypothetical protein